MSNIFSILSNHVFEQFIEEAPILFYSVDSELNCTYINPFFAKTHGVKKEDVLGKNLLSIIGKKGFDNNIPHYQEVLSGSNVEYESFFLKADGNPHYYHALYHPLFDEKKVVIGFASLIIDTTAEKILEHQSNTDALTQVHNIRKFDSDIASLLENNSLKHHALILLDIDFFKKINDTFGHDKGDEVLIALGKILTHSTQEHESVYRIGGEEFVLIINNILTVQDLIVRSEAIRVAIENQTILTEKPITVSIGSSIITHNDDKSALLKRVDEALYLSKSNG